MFAEPLGIFLRGFRETQDRHRESSACAADTKGGAEAGEPGGRWNGFFLHKEKGLPEN